MHIIFKANKKAKQNSEAKHKLEKNVKYSNILDFPM